MAIGDMWPRVVPCADHIRVGGGVPSHDHRRRRRRADPILAAAAAAAWTFRPAAAAFGGVGQQKTSFCTRNCFITLYVDFLEGRSLLCAC